MGRRRRARAPTNPRPIHENRLEADRPQFESIIDQLVDEHGEDVESACGAFAELSDGRENPRLSESLDRELAAAAAAAIHGWVKRECQAWRESHSL